MSYFRPNPEDYVPEPPPTPPVYDERQAELKVGDKVILSDEAAKLSAPSLTANVIGVIREITDEDVDEEYGLSCPEVVVVWGEGEVRHLSEADGDDPPQFVCDELVRLPESKQEPPRRSRGWV